MDRPVRTPGRPSSSVAAARFTAAPASVAQVRRPAYRSATLGSTTPSTTSRARSSIVHSANAKSYVLHTMLSACGPVLLLHSLPRPRPRTLLQKTALWNAVGARQCIHSTRNNVTPPKHCECKRRSKRGSQAVQVGWVARTRGTCFTHPTDVRLPRGLHALQTARSCRRTARAGGADACILAYQTGDRL